MLPLCNIRLYIYSLVYWCFAYSHLENLIFVWSSIWYISKSGINFMFSGKTKPKTLKLSMEVKGNITMSKKYNYIICWFLPNTHFVIICKCKDCNCYWNSVLMPYLWTITQRKLPFLVGSHCNLIFNFSVSSLLS